MWKQYLIVAALFGVYVANDRYQNAASAAAPEVAGFKAGAEYTDKEGVRYTSTVTAKAGGAYVIELKPVIQEPARSGL